MTVMKSLELAAVVALTVVCGPPRTAGAARHADTSTPPSPSPTHGSAEERRVGIEMRDVRLHADPRVVLDVPWLKGELVSSVPGQPPVFDDPRSFLIDISDAEIR